MAEAQGLNPGEWVMALSGFGLGFPAGGIPGPTAIVGLWLSTGWALNRYF